MTKKKTIRPLTAVQKKAVKQQIKKATTFTPEEVLNAIKQEPFGKLAVQVTVDTMWGNFLDTFISQFKPAPDDTPESFKARMEGLRKAVDNTMQKDVATYWYTLGTRHEAVLKAYVLGEEQTNEGKVGQ